MQLRHNYLLQDQAAKEKALAGLSTMSSAQIVSASVLQNTASARMFGTPGIAGNAVPMHTMLNSPGPGGPQQGTSPVVVKHELLNPTGLVGHTSPSPSCHTPTHLLDLFADLASSCGRTVLCPQQCGSHGKCQ